MMNLAFAGFRHGHIFGLYDMAQKNPDVRITGCFEEDETARKTAEKTLGIRFEYNSYEELLNLDTVDTIAIGDYYQKHGEMIIKALRHGKHIICDKPLCTELSELDEIERLAKETGLKICCMLDLRYMPAAIKAKELISAGAIGEVCNASFTGQHCLNYGERPSWYFEPGKQGGTINDIAIHGIDLIHFVTGKNLTNVTSARVWNKFADQVPDFKDCGQFMVEMDGMAVMADVSYAAPRFKGTLPTYWNFCFWGKKGMMRFNLKDSSKLFVYTEEETVLNCKDCDSDYLKDFIKEIQGLPSAMNTEDILESARQTLKIQKCAE